MRVFIVDDHAVFRLGLKQILRDASGFEIVGEASTAREAFPLVEQSFPDVVVLDLALPGMDGLSAARELRRRVPDSNILVLSLHESVDDVSEALEAGVRGYAFKSEPIEALVAAIRRVGQGGRYVPARIGRLLERPLETPDGLGVLRLLSEREREVFRLASEAMTNVEIARELCISRKTVETHRYRIQKKLGLRNGAELFRFAALHGLLRGARGSAQGLEDPLSDGALAANGRLAQDVAMSGHDH